MRCRSARNGGRYLIGAAVTFVFAVLTVVVPSWIEHAFGVDPDGGDGLLEMTVVATCALATVVLGSLGVLARRRAGRIAG